MYAPASQTSVFIRLRLYDRVRKMLPDGCVHKCVSEGGRRVELNTKSVFIGDLFKKK